MKHFFKPIIQRIKLFSMLLRTDRSINILPPLFVLRDPVMSLLKQERRTGTVCSIMFIHINHFEKLVRYQPLKSVHQMLQSLEQVIRNGILDYIDASHLIGVTRIQRNVICILMKEDEQYYAKETDELCRRVCQGLQADLDEELHSIGFTVQLSMHCTQLSNRIEDEQLAILHAAHELNGASSVFPKPCNTLKQEMNRIIKEKNVTVLTQPIMQLQTGEIYGWEILTRGPADSSFFLPVSLFEHAERAHLLSELEFVVIEKAFQEIQKRQIQEQVFINVTSETLCHPHFERFIDKLMMQMGTIQPTQIVFEITEQHLIRDYRIAVQVIQRLRKRQFRFAIDDAGTGYSNFHTILEIIPDIIKIDKSLIQEIDRVAAKESLLKALLTFAKDIQCQVIAEGIEREEEAGVLFRHEVEMGQGYYFAKPETHRESDQHVVFDELKQKINRLRTLTAS